MLDLRPIGYVIGLLVATLGLAMIFPLLLDLFEGRGEWHVFATSGVITVLTGIFLALACDDGVVEGLSIQQTFLMTSSVWVVLPLFGAIPFLFGAPQAAPVDALFESMSGLTTTGATVFSGLDDMPRGILLWRGMLQWFGGIGVIVFAMVFLPELKIGGMQIFKSEAFDTFGKILPRASAIATQISGIYVMLTLACIFCYTLVGMDLFDAVVHAMTTISTGGFANYDASFGAFPGAAEYIAVTFMVLAALPFVRYVQMINGAEEAIWHDAQIRAFIGTVLLLTCTAALVLTQGYDTETETAFRKALFNLTSIISGTGYASADYMQWGGFLVVLFFFVGLIGGCAGSTSCSIKIFRYQILMASIRAQLQKISLPHGVFNPRYNGRVIDDDTLSSVMSFFVFFIVTLGVLAVLLGLTGLDFTTSVSGAAAAIGNIGPGLGAEIGPSGNYANLNDTAKWLLIAGMFIGRLELLVVFVIFTRNFWRA